VETPPLVGYYAGGWIWPDDQIDWVKSLLPFFDKLSLILPPELVPQAVRDDDVIAQPLIDLGILETRDPADVLDHKATTEIVDEMRRLIEQREGDSLQEFTELVTAPENWQTITYTHFGIYDSEVQELLRDLRARGLAGALDPKTGLFPLDRNLHAAVVAVCAQKMCRLDREKGLDVVPFRPPTGRSAPRREPRMLAEVLSGDLANVGPNLSRLPLADVLAFRAEHLAAYNKYMRDLRTAARLLETTTDQVDRKRLLLDRQAELREAADSLRRSTRSAGLKTGLSVGLALVGVGTSFVAGPVVGAVVAAAASAAGLIPDSRVDSPYTYLFKFAKS
jgi:hypothetical protein